MECGSEESGRSRKDNYGKEKGKEARGRGRGEDGNVEEGRTRENKKVKGLTSNSFFNRDDNT